MVKLFLVYSVMETSSFLQREFRLKRKCEAIYGEMNSSSLSTIVKN